MGMVTMRRGSLRKAHRWLGLIFSLSIFASAGSGILHNVMTHTQSPPPAARPSGEALAANKITVPVAEAIAKVPDAAVQAVNIRGIRGEPWYQMLTKGDGPPIYVSAVDGRIDPLEDERYAEQIASAFLGGATVRKAGYLTAFDNEYLNIFRVLPVYRFNAEDAWGTRLYVSTLTGSVTRHTDNRRQFEANVFTNLHKLGFIPNKTVRDVVLTSLTFGVFLVAGLGIVLFVATSPIWRRTNSTKDDDP